MAAAYEKASGGGGVVRVPNALRVAATDHGDDVGGSEVHNPFGFRGGDEDPTPTKAGIPPPAPLPAAAAAPAPAPVVPEGDTGAPGHRVSGTPTRPVMRHEGESVTYRGDQTQWCCFRRRHALVVTSHRVILYVARPPCAAGCRANPDLIEWNVFLRDVVGTSYVLRRRWALTSFVLAFAFIAFVMAGIYTWSRVFQVAMSLLGIALSALGTHVLLGEHTYLAIHSAHQPPLEIKLPYGRATAAIAHLHAARTDIAPLRAGMPDSALPTFSGIGAATSTPVEWASSGVRRRAAAAGNRADSAAGMEIPTATATGFAPSRSGGGVASPAAPLYPAVRASAPHHDA